MFYDRFKRICFEKGVSEMKAATDIGLSTSTTWKWRTGATPRYATVKKLAAYFGVSPEYFLEDGDDNNIQITNSQIASGNTGTVTMTKNGPIPSQQGTGSNSLEMEFWNIFTSLDFQGKAAVMLKATEERKRMEQG